MPVFLRAYSGKSKVYEVALEAGVVMINVGPPPDPRLVDWIELFDPVTGDPAVQFSVFSKSLHPSGGNPLWKKLDFQTRCFLTRDGVPNLARVKLLLNDNVQVTDFEILDQFPKGGPAFPSPIRSLSQFTFLYQVPAPFSYGPPEILERLGVQFYGATDWRGPILVCRPLAEGLEFLVTLDLAGPEQEVRPYGIEFDSDDPTLPDGTDTRRALTFWQRTAKVDRTAYEPAFWILGVDLPPGIVLDAWSRAVVTPFLDSLNMVRSGLPASFVPRMTPEAGEKASFTVSFALVDHTPSLDVISEADCVLRDPESPLTPGKLNIVTRTIQLAQGKTVQCQAVFPNLRRVDGQGLQAQCRIGAPPSGTPTHEKVCESQAGYCLGFQHTFDSYERPSVSPSLRFAWGPSICSFRIRRPLPKILPGGSDRSAPVCARCAMTMATTFRDRSFAWTISVSRWP